MPGQFPSRDKDDGHHSIRQSRKPHNTRKPDGSIFYITGVMANEVLHSGNTDFGLICSYDLDLDPMTFIYELDP